MNKKIPASLAVGLIAITLLIAGALVWQSKNELSKITADQRPGSTHLPSVEVREYNGQKLSPSGDVVDQGIKGTQNIDIAKYNLQVNGLVNNPKSFTYDQVLQLPKFEKVVDLNCVEGWSAKILWEGAKVSDLIDAAGPQSGANTVIFHAADDYASSLPLDYIKNNNILLAFKMNGLVLSPAKGFPFQLVAEQKWGYKWVKWVTQIELSNDPNYKGYWESRGYNNNGDLNGPKMGN
jgi:DMSO/TMAO reductase YedYZ molybdopterin-dependent catalytic subunit